MRICLFLFAISIFFFSSCKKYDEGSGLSFRSKTSRLTGKWEVNRYTFTHEGETYNGFNVYVPKQITCASGQFVDIPTYYRVTSWVWNFASGGQLYYEVENFVTEADLDKSKEACRAVYKEDYLEVLRFNGHWGFDGKKENIKAKYVDVNEDFEYEILELRDKSMRFQYTISGRTYKLNLKKIE